jgi:hypothetical protein
MWGLLSLLRRGLFGRVSDAYLLITFIDATGFCPGLLSQVNGHFIAFVFGMLVVSLICDLVQMVTKPDLPPCEDVEPELNLGDEDK